MCQGLSGPTIDLAVCSRLSSCSFVCPPPVRPAPSPSSFPSSSIPLPPAHVVFGCDGDVGDRRCSFSAGASMAWPCSSVSSASVGSSFSSRDVLHPVGPRRLPSRSVASARRPMKSCQGRCGNVLTQRGRGAAAASLNIPSVAPPHSSSKVILNRQVTIIDLGLASPCVATHSGTVVGSQVSGRQ